MPQIVNGGSERGQEDFIDGTGGILSTIRVRVSGIPDIAADQSLRRNPTWYTLGHISLLWRDEVILWESWLNYPDQVFPINPSSFVQGDADQLGLPPNLYDPSGSTDIPLTVRWQLRGLLTLDIWYGS